MDDSVSEPILAMKEAQDPDVEYLHLKFRVHRSGLVDLLPSFVFAGPPPSPNIAPEAPIVCELRAARGDSVLVSQRSHRLSFHSGDDDPWVDYLEILPWHPDAAIVAFVRDRSDLALIEVAGMAPKFKQVPKLRLEDDSRAAVLTWGVEDPDENTTYMVRYSNDGGRTWAALASGIKQAHYRVSLPELPGGAECTFQVLASSGIRTETAQTEFVAVEVKARRAFITSPADGLSLQRHESVVLRGCGYSSNFGTADAAETTWSSSIDGFLGYGYDVSPQGLTPGSHVITLSVADGLGDHASRSIRVRVL